jgi:hypothetical protein
VAPLTSVLQPAWKSWLVGEQKWLTLAFAMALLGLGMAGYVFWHQLAVPAVVEAAPAAPAPVMAPRPIAPPLGVVLHEVEALATQAENENGPVALTVQGRVANTTQRTVVLPQLQAELVDETGGMNDFWPVPLVTTTLPAQSELPFAVSFTNPTAKGWRLVWVAREAALAPSPSVPSAPAPAVAVPPVAKPAPQSHHADHP